MHVSGDKRRRVEAAKSSGDGGSSGSSVLPPAAKRARIGSSPAPSARGAAAAASSSSSSSSRAAAPAQWSKVLVKVGEGGAWGVFEPDDDADDVLNMHLIKLLKALKKDEIFGGYVEGVKQLGDCAVFIRKGELPESEDEPPAGEEAGASKFVELKGAKTVRAAAVDGKCKGERLFIFVRLPAVAASSSVASSSAAAAIAPAGLAKLRDPSTGAADVLAAMHSQWKELVERLKAERAKLSEKAVPMLHRSTAAISLKAAPKLCVTTLLNDEGSKTVRLGTFTLPPLPTDILEGPKGLMLNKEQHWFHLEQRAGISREFLEAMRAGSSSRFGVLLSGPNGTGKSAVGVEAALSSFAHGLVCVYIPKANVWVAAAKAGHGDGFLLERLLRQNVDLIAAQPVLRKALAPALVMDPAAVSEMDAPLANSIMDALRAALKANPALGVGIIMDEVQTITFAIRDGMSDKALLVERTAANYFKDWHNWDNRNDIFVRMDIASSHGARELKLPSGEEHRLRVIQPWAADLVAALTTKAGSPCAFSKAQDSARQHIIFTAGGIPRSLFRGHQLLQEALVAYDKLSATKKKDVGSRLGYATRNVVAALRVAMEENCSRWFLTLTADEMAAASSEMLQLVRGEIAWTRFKGLYDDGLVACCDGTLNVKPVSAVASSVIMAVLAGHYLEAVRKPLRKVTAGAERGFALELQVIARLAKVGKRMLPAMTLKGDKAAPMVPAYADERLPFDRIDDLEASNALARLHVPTSKSFSCDAITVPPTSAAPSEPIVVWETSVTSPRDGERIDKVLKWFGADGIVTTLRAAHPRRPIVCALCCPEKLDAAAAHATKHAELVAAAAGIRTGGTPVVRVSVVDTKGLQALGVLV